MNLWNDCGVTYLILVLLTAVYFKVAVINNDHVTTNFS